MKAKFVATIIPFILGVILPLSFGILNRAYAGEECFRDHLREAIAINKERRPLYMNLTNLASRQISDRLIRAERFAIFNSYLLYNFDAEAAPFQRQGINIVCDEYVPMSKTPAFQAIAPKPFPSLKNFKQIEPYRLLRRLQNARDAGFEPLAATAREVIHEIEAADARFNCMTRHLVESLGRIAALAPRHAANAEARGLPSTEDLSTKMISAHFLMLPEAVSLDLLAAPMQAKGVAIICQDVPPITF